MKCPSCGQDRQHFVKGLCILCTTGYGGKTEIKKPNIADLMYMKEINEKYRREQEKLKKKKNAVTF